MRKNLVFGLAMVCIASAMFMNGVFAGFGGGNNSPNPPAVPEPVSMLLLLASGGTYAGIRYLRARRNSKKLSNYLDETEENR